jgi:hypothetical protein
MIELDEARRSKSETMTEQKKIRMIEGNHDAHCFANRSGRLSTGARGQTAPLQESWAGLLCCPDKRMRERKTALDREKGWGFHLDRSAEQLRRDLEQMLSAAQEVI